MTARYPNQVLAALVALTALAGCATDGAATPSSRSADAAASRHPVPGAAVREGGSIATMAEQYGPRRGATAATGASAWVAAAPPPAFVATGPAPPSVQQAPPPVAAAPARPAASAVDLVRPEAADPATPASAPATPGLSADNLARARQLFGDQSCGACHALADAGSSGGVGPALDGNPNLSRDHIIVTVKEGRGPMPGFAAAIEEADIGLLADYIRQVARK